MDMQEAMLEERYAAPRNEIVRLLSTGSNFNVEVFNIFMAVFKEEVDYTKHGGVFWALMHKSQGVKRGVLGSHFRVYMNYYYHYLIASSQRTSARRTLDDRDLAFVTATAAFGFARGAQEFDNALKQNSLDIINRMLVDRVSFLTFFWNANQGYDCYSWCGCWKLIDSLWDIWDQKDPVRIHGFISGELSFQMLKTKSKDFGTFSFRFSSQGGIAVDYVGNSELKKTLWKAQALKDTPSFMKLLYDAKGDGPNLKYLIDTSGPQPRLVHKDQSFPTQPNMGYTTSGYASVKDDDENMGDVTEQTTEAYVLGFMDQNFGGF